MKIIAAQYNALYTLQKEEKLYIRQFSKFDDVNTEDQIVWYQQSNMNGAELMSMIEDEDFVSTLEEGFTKLLE
jgi:hypothetical protein